MLKWDGHTHTEYCPHGNVHDVEEMIQRAIALGFERYSVTEHAPLPKDFLSQCAGPDYPIDTAGMAFHDLEHYFNKRLSLKVKYRREIDIKLGVELDFLPDHQDWTRDFLREYGNILEDSVLSVHFLRGQGGIRAIDYSAEDFKEGLLDYYGSFQKVQQEYLKMVQNSVLADLGKCKPQRIGHISLVHKFYRAFPEEDTTFSTEDMQLYSDIFSAMEQRKYMLDFNMAGNVKEYCLEPYPPLEILQKFRPKISLVYGSDSHQLSDVGREYDKYTNLKKELSTDKKQIKK
jgi:histidinol-phosphatase (PHP family)